MKTCKDLKKGDLFKFDISTGHCLRIILDHKITMLIWYDEIFMCLNNDKNNMIFALCNCSQVFVKNKMYLQDKIILL